MAFIEWILRWRGIKIQMGSSLIHFWFTLGPGASDMGARRSGQSLQVRIFPTFDPPSLPYQNIAFLPYPIDPNYKNCHRTQKWQAKDILEPRKEFKSYHLGTHWQHNGPGGPTQSSTKPNLIPPVRGGQHKRKRQRIRAIQPSRN